MGALPRCTLIAASHRKENYMDFLCTQLDIFLKLYFSVSDFGFVSTSVGYVVGYVVKCDQVWKIARISYIFSFNSDNLFTCQFALPTFEKFHFIVNNLMSSNFSLSFEWIFTSVTRNWSIFCVHPLVTLEEV